MRSEANRRLIQRAIKAMDGEIEAPESEESAAFAEALRRMRASSK